MNAKSEIHMGLAKKMHFKCSTPRKVKACKLCVETVHILSKSFSFLFQANPSRREELKPFPGCFVILVKERAERIYLHHLIEKQNNEFLILATDILEVYLFFLFTPSFP